MAGFGFAGAAAGVQNVLRQQQEDALKQQQIAGDLAQQLAAREYQRQLILQAQQRLGFDQQKFAADQATAQAQNQAMNDAASAIESGAGRNAIVGKLVRAGKATARDVLDDPQAQLQQKIDEARQVGDIETANRLKVIGAQHGYSMQEIGARTAGDVAAINARSKTAATGANGQPSPAQIPAAQKEDLITMGTLSDMADQATTLGDQIGWKGVGGMHTGSISQFAMKNLGYGTQDEQKLRNLIANIQGTLARLRGGTSFTPNEQALLERYTPTIDDGDAMIKAKLASLKDFIATRKANTMSVVGGQPSAQPNRIYYDANGNPR